MSIFDKVTRLEKRIEKLTTRGDVPLEPMEIRRAILDEVESLVEPGPRSKPIFPFTRLVHILVVPNQYLFRKRQVVRWYRRPEPVRG